MCICLTTTYCSSASPIASSRSIKLEERCILQHREGPFVRIRSGRNRLVAQDAGGSVWDWAGTAVPSASLVPTRRPSSTARSKRALPAERPPVLESGRAEYSGEPCLPATTTRLSGSRNEPGSNAARGRPVFLLPDVQELENPPPEDPSGDGRGCDPAHDGLQEHAPRYPGRGMPARTVRSPQKPSWNTTRATLQSGYRSASPPLSGIVATNGDLARWRVQRGPRTRGLVA